MYELNKKKFKGKQQFLSICLLLNIVWFFGISIIFEIWIFKFFDWLFIKKNFLSNILNNIEGFFMVWFIFFTTLILIIFFFFIFSNKKNCKTKKLSESCLNLLTKETSRKRWIFYFKLVSWITFFTHFLIAIFHINVAAFFISENIVLSIVIISFSIMSIFINIFLFYLLYWKIDFSVIK